MRRYQFSIPYTQYLDHHGRAVQSLPPWALDLQRLISFYRAMVLVRTFDQKQSPFSAPDSWAPTRPVLGKNPWALRWVMRWTARTCLRPHTAIMRHNCCGAFQFRNCCFSGAGMSVAVTSGFPATTFPIAFRSPRRQPMRQVWPRRSGFAESRVSPSASLGMVPPRGEIFWNRSTSRGSGNSRWCM